MPRFIKSRRRYSIRRMPLPIAAVISSASSDTTPLLWEFVNRLQARGLRIRGLIQNLEPGRNGCDIVLVDIESGARHPITQDLGAASAACRLDPALLVEAGNGLRAVPNLPTDLAVFNRFGALEAQGGGFHAEMLAVMAGGTPLLAVVSDKQIAAWRSFTGGLGSELRPQIDDLEHWFHDVQAAGACPMVTPGEATRRDPAQVDKRFAPGS